MRPRRPSSWCGNDGTGGSYRLYSITWGRELEPRSVARIMACRLCPIAPRSLISLHDRGAVVHIGSVQFKLVLESAVFNDGPLERCGVAVKRKVINKWFVYNAVDRSWKIELLQCFRELATILRTPITNRFNCSNQVDMLLKSRCGSHKPD